MPNKRYTFAGLGGTFDHFHIGHESFLRFAAQHAQTLLVGITAPPLTQGKQFASTIEHFDQRYFSVKNFCEKNGIEARLVELSDVYGPTTDASSTVEAIIVTTDTQVGAQKINQRRKEKQLPALPVHVHQLLIDETGQPINSTRIRGGEIDRHGIVFSQLFTRDRSITDAQRALFSQPQGTQVLVPSIDRSPMPTCVVGDVVLDAFAKNNWQYDLGVFDRHTQRTPTAPGQFFEPVADRVVTNKAGTISQQFVATLQSWQRDRFKHLFVEGEEDLATVVLVLQMPLGSHVYYGQPNVGMIELVVSEELKARFYAALNE